MSSQVLISKSALVHNLRAYRRAVGGTKIMSVVKSNAYGHGTVITSKTIEKDTDWFGTASGAEALELRLAGIKKPILVLSFYDQTGIAELVKRNVSLVVYDLKQARLISDAAKKIKKIANIHLKVDTGTSRLGIMPNQVANFVHELLLLKNIKIEGVFSHFASSEDDEKFTRHQNHLFENVIEELEWRGIDPIKHIACTASMLAIPQSRHDLVRLGIGLYGLTSYKSTSATMLKFANLSPRPALSWQTQVVAVKELPKGAFVGYGLSYKTKRPTKLAVLPVGYFDGYDRKLSNSGEVAIRGKRCKILGRVCMNLTMVDATNVKGVKVADKVELIGKKITADELAEKTNTINYEVVSRINPLIERKYV